MKTIEDLARAYVEAMDRLEETSANLANLQHDLFNPNYRYDILLRRAMSVIPPPWPEQWCDCIGPHPGQTECPCELKAQGNARKVAEILAGLTETGK